MRSTTELRLTPRQRLSRGLKYSTVGPVDVTRGAVGLGVDSARSTTAWVGDRYRHSQLAKQLKAELAAAQETIAHLPDTLTTTRKSRDRRRTLLIAGIGVAVLAGGAAAFVVVRRSTQPEPSTLEPTVDVAPKP